jgi:hypothetical protein
VIDELRDVEHATSAVESKVRVRRLNSNVSESWIKMPHLDCNAPVHVFALDNFGGSTLT